MPEPDQIAIPDDYDTPEKRDAAWNRFRQENRGFNPNLRGQNLAECDLREINLSGAYLENANLSYAHLENADLSTAFGYRFDETFIRDSLVSHDS